jgi:hypothetical protein
MHVPVVPAISPPLMQWKTPSLPSLLEFVEAVHVLAVAQLSPSYPALHELHVHDGVMPPTVPPLMQ